MNPSYAIRVFSYCELSASGEPVETRGGQPRAVVPILLEGAAPRAVFSPVVLFPLLFVKGGSEVVNVLRAAAIQVLRDFYVPERWSPVLYAYLRDHAVVVPAEESRGRSVLDTLVSHSQFLITQGDHHHTVWDLVSGRKAAIDELRPRAEVYRASVANVEELRLDTRFVLEFASGKVSTESAKTEFIREFSIVKNLRLFVSALRMEDAGVVLEYESTVKEWFAAVGDECGTYSADRRIAEQLIASLALSDALEDVTRRVGELRSELEAQTDDDFPST